MRPIVQRAGVSFTKERDSRLCYFSVDFPSHVSHRGDGHSVQAHGYGLGLRSLHAIRPCGNAEHLRQAVGCTGFVYDDRDVFLVPPSEPQPMRR